MNIRAAAILLLSTLSGCAGGAAHLRDTERLREEKYRRDIAAAPRRGPGEPIRVLFLNPETREEREKGGVQPLHDALLAALQGDDVLRVSDLDPAESSSMRSSRDMLQILMAGAQEVGKVADVYVMARLGAENALSLPSPGKIPPDKVLVYRASLSPGHEFRAGTASVKGSLSQGQKIAQDLAEAIKRKVKDSIGPALPSAAAIQAIRERYVKEAMRNAGRR